MCHARKTSTMAAGMSLLLLLFFTIFGNVYSVHNFVRKAKCLIPNGVDHTTRALLLQQCISDKYGQGNETRCYEELGCFEMEDPWIGLLRPFPSPYPPEDIDMKLVLYTRNDPEGNNVMLWPSIDMMSSDFDYDRPANVFIIHGFTNNGRTPWLHELKDAYLMNVDANVFIVDWGEGATMVNYLQVASNTRIVGAELSRFGKFLIANGVTGDSIHVIGHSLGAHIASYMANGLLSVSPVRRITGLDPAQPGFEQTSKQVRLDKDDALNVDVIHTDAKPFIPLIGFGMMQPVGDVDFYMNGGSRQPGCISIDTDEIEIKSIEDLITFPVETLHRIVSCSHSRAVEYFIWSLKLKNCTMWGRKMSLVENILKITSIGTLDVFDPLIEALSECDEETCSVVGLDAFQLKARGSFAVTTNSEEPYCDPPKDLPKKLSKWVGSILGKIKWL